MRLIVSYQITLDDYDEIELPVLIDNKLRTNSCIGA